MAAALLALMGAAGAPTPLFGVYQARWHFTAEALTVVFAVYAVALLATLLVTGSLSDHLGRRPVLAAGLLLDAGAMLAFLVAHGLPGLLLARVLQGVGTGVAMGVVSAALVDLDGPRADGGHPWWTSSVVNSVAPTLGLGLGAAVSGALVDVLPSPAAVVFGALAVCLVALALLLAAVPETVARRPGAARSMRPRPRVPAGARASFVAASPVMLASWAMGGLYLSLGPALAAVVLGVQRHVVGALLVTTLMLAGSVAVLVTRERPAARVLLGGTAVLAVGTVATLAALDARSPAGFFVATAVAGTGFGTSFSGTLRTVAPTVEPQERGELFAALYLLSYLGFSVPAVAAGVAVQHAGLLTAATSYGGVVVVLALTALALTWRGQANGRGPLEARCRTAGARERVPVRRDVPSLHRAAPPPRADLTERTLTR